MHESVMTFVKRVLEAARPDWPTTRVLEIGSYDVNGSVRTIVEPLQPLVYLGTDMRAGPGVDLVCSAEELPDSSVAALAAGLYEGSAGFDLVICCEVLEHAERWRSVVLAMKALCKPGGLLILTTRAPGFPLHEYPGDFWRFTPSGLAEAFADFGGAVASAPKMGAWIESDPQAPGVFVAARKPRLTWPEPYRMPGGS